MDALEEKSINVSRGFTYRYYVSPTKDSDTKKPPLVLHHGFPETAHLWAPLLPMLTTLPNRLIIPDLLGFGGTSKPADPQSYAYDLMTQDLLEILDAEGVEKVISVGHDHGSGSAAKFYNHAPDRTAALILLNVAYLVPNKESDFDLAGINAITTNAFGYPIFEYWNFLTAADAPAILEENLDRMWDCAHAGTFEAKKSIYCVKNGLRRYLTDHSTPRIDTKPYAHNKELKQRWMSQFREGGLSGPVCWYSSRTQGVQFESDKKIPDANLKVTVPTLFVGCELDTVCRMELIQPAKDAGMLPDLVIETMTGVGHWPMYEDPERTAEAMIKFVLDKDL
jgi:pimeloyl-ACP methyl ester carboxylesterase